MRAWIKLACVVLAWTVLPASVASTGQGRPEHLAQVSARTTNLSFTSAHPAARPAPAALTSITPARTYAVQRGDTLSAIAARFGVRGGWPALYAANRSAAGPDPDAVHTGIRLTIPSPATSPGSGSALGNRAPSGTAPNGTVPDGAATSGPSPAQPQPSTQPASPAPASPPARRRRRRRGVIPAPPPHQAGQALEPHQANRVLPPHQANQPTQITPLDPSVSEIPVMPFPAHEGRIEPARIVMADHDRLVVARDKQDDTIFVLCPPGENPADILRVARLVLPEGHYGRLAEQLGLPANWPMNQ